MRIDFNWGSIMDWVVYNKKENRDTSEVQE